eukprot:UN27534
MTMYEKSDLTRSELETMMEDAINTDGEVVNIYAIRHDEQANTTTIYFAISGSKPLAEWDSEVKYVIDHGDLDGKLELSLTDVSPESRSDNSPMSEYKSFDRLQPNQNARNHFNVNDVTDPAKYASITYSVSLITPLGESPNNFKNKHHNGLRRNYTHETTGEFSDEYAPTPSTETPLTIELEKVEETSGTYHTIELVSLPEMKNEIQET